MTALAFVGSALGAAVTFLIPRDAFDPIVLVALVVVGAYVVFRPALGEETELRFAGARHRHVAAAMATGFIVGFYDGALDSCVCSSWSSSPASSAGSAGTCCRCGDGALPTHGMAMRGGG